MAPSRTKLYENDPKWVWKFVVRVSAIVFALISISIIGGDHGKDLFADVDGDHGKHIFAGVDGDTVAFRGIIPCGVSVVWNLINIIALLIRNRPIPAGAIQGCELVLVVSIGVVTGWFIIWDITRFYKGSNVPEVVALVFAFFTAFCHIALFISGCFHRQTRPRDVEGPQFARQSADTTTSGQSSFGLQKL